MLLVIGVTGHTGKYFLQELVKNKYKEKIRFLIRKENEEAILNPDIYSPPLISFMLYQSRFTYSNNESQSFLGLFLIIVW